MPILGQIQRTTNWYFFLFFSETIWRQFAWKVKSYKLSGKIFQCHLLKILSSRKKGLLFYVTYLLDGQFTRNTKPFLWKIIKQNIPVYIYFFRKSSAAILFVNLNRNALTSLHINAIFIFEPVRNKTYKKTCVTSKGSNKPIHPPSMARVLIYSSLDSRLWSACTDVQADLLIWVCWSHKSYRRFCCGLAHFYFSYFPMNLHYHNKSM